MSQTLQDIEIILVDDGSPDNCPQICDDYAKKDSRIKVIHKQNAGLGFARNSGLDIATSKYVAFVDSDDYVHQNMYQTLYEKAEQYNADAVICGFARVNQGVSSHCVIDGMPETEALIDSKKCYLPEVIGSLPNVCTHQSYGISTCNILFKNKIIQANNLHFVSERKFVSEDLIFQLDFASCASYLLLYPADFYSYCNNNGSLTKRYNPTRFDKQIELCKEIERRAKSYGYTISDLDLRIKRMMLYESLFAINEAITYLPYQQSISRLQYIANNKPLNDTLNSYPICDMTFKNRLFYTLLKKKAVFIIWVLYQVKRIFS